MIRRFLSGRPADILNICFLSFLTVLTIVFNQKVEGPVLLIGVYLGLIGAQAVLIALKDKGKALRFVYDLVFPTVSILVIFDSLGRIVHAINPRDIDPLLIRIDYLLFGCHPTVAIEKIVRPPLTDLLQIAYSSYYFLPITLGAVLIFRRNPAFDRALFFIMLCFYLSYAGYLLMPALGPRFTMSHLQTRDLEGWLVAGPIQELLNRLEGVKRDAFPSGHTGVALTVLFLAFRFERRLFRWFLPFVTALILATVYCRYHYVVDVIAGALLTLMTLALGEWVYGYRTQRDDPHY
ncbi:MAG: phosphatase PAP2 family protein [Nitrospiraceae bacterium]|nr:phosphatase PAP2 family protein [Nitrospiraceae bacterium]